MAPFLSRAIMHLITILPYSVTLFIIFSDICTMKKALVLSVMSLSAMLLTQCAKKTAPTSGASSVDEVAEMKSKYNAGQILQGKAVFEGSCQKCHQLYQPAEFTIRKWDKILPQMSHKASLTAEQAGMVRAWVITNAKNI